MLNTTVAQIRALIAKGDRLSKRLVENDISACRAYADAGERWAHLRDNDPNADTDEWCERELGRAHSTMLGYLRLAKNWDRYAKRRRALGDCGEYGFDFALSLTVQAPRGTNTGDSITRNGGRTRGKPDGQNTRTDLRVFRRMKRMFPYDFDLCAARKKVALCDQYSNDFLNADVRGKCVWCNGPFGMSAQLAAHLPHCGARHITWLTLASVNSKWFHTDVLPHAKHILFPTRRLAFRGYDNVTKWDVMLVLYGVIPKHMTHGITCSGIELP